MNSDENVGIQFTKEKHIKDQQQLVNQNGES